MVHQNFFLRNRIEIFAVACAVMAGLLWSAIHPTLQVNAAENQADAVCNNLAVQESPDKNYYIFRAEAKPVNGATITGYKYDFGDKESFTYNFPKDAKDRNTATVNHTYIKAGTFSANVSVLVTQNNKTSTITSKNCKESITVGQGQVTELAQVGPESMLPLFGIGIIAGSVYWRRKQMQQIRTTK
jgi:hypothetical protein